jgi:hypothetical protein
MSQLKAYSQLLDETVDLGLPTEDLDQLLQLGDFMASGRDESLIVFVEGPAAVKLQRWIG